MKKRIARITQVTILPEGEPLFREAATVIKIDDYAAGEFVEVKQQIDTTEDTNQTIEIMPEDWPLMRLWIDRFVNDIKKREDK